MSGQKIFTNRMCGFLLDFMYNLMIGYLDKHTVKNLR